MNKKQSYKVTLVGDIRVGKASIVNEKLNHSFQENTLTTIGSNSQDISVYNSENNEVLLNVWDTAGSERYHSLLSIYIRDSNVILIVASIENRDLIESLPKLKEFINENVNGNVPIICVFNKIDLSPNTFSFKLLYRSRFEDLFSSFHFVSAKTSEGIENLFIDIVNQVALNTGVVLSQSDSQLSDDSNPNSTCSC
jgi:small GTP-binding protein